MADKMTKKDWFEEIKNIVKASDYEAKDAAVDFINAQVTQLDKRAADAAARKAEKQAEGDELREAVVGILTDDYKTGDEILAELNWDGVTKAKVVARLNQAIKAGIAEKDYIKVGSRKIIGYRLIQEEGV